MKKVAAKVAMCSLFGAFVLSGCATRAVIVARPGPPVGAVIVAAPGPRAIWVPGHWVWRPYMGRYVWVRGHWR
jgi:hypothetical protein